mgnify:CR=1 FL=1
MAFDQKDNNGALFRNARRTEEKHPHATGKAMIGGVLYWISAWTKQRDNGEKYQSLSFKPVEEKKPEPKKDESFFDDFEDDIPFN